MSKRILIKIPMRVIDADVVTGYMTGGIPSVTAVEGLTHLMQRRFNERLDPELVVDSWSYIIERITYHEGKYGYVGYEKDRKGKDKVLAPSMRDDKKANLDCSIILNIETNLTVSALNDALVKGELNYVFNRLRLAGGEVQVKGLRSGKPYNKLDFIEFSKNGYESLLRTSGMNSMLIEDQTHLIDEFESNRIHRLDRLVDLVSKQSVKTKERAYNADAVAKHESVLSLFNGAKAIYEPMGIEVVSAIGTTLSSDLIISRASTNDDLAELILSLDPKFDKESGCTTKKAKDEINSLIEQLVRAKRTFSILGFPVTDASFVELYKSEYLEQQEREYYGYLFALNIGYCGIGSLQKRKGTRIDALHTYAEPVLGVARARTIGSVIYAIKEDEEVNCFWSNSSLFHSEDISDNMYVVVGESL